MLAFVLLNCIIPVSACGSRVDQIDTSDDDKRYLWNMSQWDIWKPEDDGKSMDEYIAMYKKLTEQANSWDELDVNRDPGLPPPWREYGEGIIGVPPPPWAFVPNAHGRPNLCFVFPAKGNCNETIIRWAFNPSTQRCHQFMYSGCGANENNFKTKPSCIRACTSVPSSPCETEGNMDFVDMLFGYYPDERIKKTSGNISKG
ncbi:unnamed protein product [Pieris brassicae]|uniref:BPTI/Kunitz inhibitor domain-containing protein n=1 Tax=Pieris brassicae TaxID=7116 RepID=A0A9P0THU1_PIEBR|nr:unnamed protein product [Pieris brassicae]